MADKKEELLAAAKQAREKAYAPYSSLGIGVCLCPSNDLSSY